MRKMIIIMKKISPYIIIVLSFLSIILIGGILLILPISKQAQGHLSFVDALFISTSAVTITGLSPVANLSTLLSPFGKVVLGILIQIGGLSVITISVFVMYLIGAKIGLSNRILIKESFNQTSLSGMVKLVKKIIIFTLVIESFGFIANMIVFVPQYELVDAIGLSLFHAVSSFNNAGFDILGDQSLQGYNGHVLLNLSTAILIMLGGLGFIVLNDILTKKSYKKLMIHSKIVLKVNLVLWSLGFGFFLLSKVDGKNLNVLEAFFLSVTARTAGFTTINMGTISSLTALILMVLMFIGASPSSTGGGIKTTTLYALFKSTTSYAKGKTTTTHNRLITDETRHKASILLTTAIMIVLVATSLIIMMENIDLEKAIFEVISAFANVGLSMNLTPTLSNASKIVLSIVMFIGRVGPITIISIFNTQWYKKGMDSIEYIEEKMMIG
ncbi:H(+)-transporting ATPase [Acholeplasma laidlawii]|uniref:Trk system potassium uptake protein TrkG n=3 Tax=Acholeplasma laidlawii TaxID=2148 RepID=A9NH06_ACHLI|nr:trk system potassium uptake protein TrkG [Acholeplasma laidlawii PG-8A]PII01853.1 H(+)-transporting ATPase [Acholeplasma laidlawii]PII03236.1 H(+)-transporting ATPase [Acholeplasma laidlawii]TRX99549.1 H(+)-transporting ATPase [Acholeplasma laidlawii]